MATTATFFSSKLLRGISTTVLALGLLAAGPDAHADANSKVTLGMGFHATIHRATSYDEGNAMAGGAQVRLRLARFFTLRLDYDFAQDQVVDPDQAQTLSQLVPYPDLKLGLAISLYPNKYLAPYLCGGAGFNTGTGVDVPVFFGGVGVETTLFKHWVIGANFQAFYATAGRYADFMKTAKEAAQNIKLVDLIKPHTFQVGIELTYYL